MTERQGSQGSRESTVLGRRLGGELLELRTAAGMTQGRAAQALSASTGKIAKIEGGWVPVRDPDIRALCDLYRVKDPKTTGGLLELARIDRERRKAKGWWNDFANLGDMREYVSLENAATVLRAWQLSYIPGLLQTPAYIRALAQSDFPNPHPDNGDQLVASRLTRQTRLTGESPLRLRAVIHEGALLHHVGTAEVMREQLNHLARASRLANITVQVLPFTAGAHIGMDGAFNIMSFSEPGSMDVAYVEIPFTRLWVEGGELVAQYDGLFEALTRCALPGSESAAFIEAIVKGL